jgi:protein phosphatase
MKNNVLEAGNATDVGLIRENNEDSCYVDKENGLFIVADGLGGHAGGEIASKLAVEAIANFFKKEQEGSKKNFMQSIKNAVQEAHEIILKEQIADPLLRGMGTTLVLGLFEDAGNLYVANVGDSRAYLCRDNKLLLLSEDDSLVANLVKQGRITEDQARAHYKRNIVTQVIGINPFSECHQKKVNLRDKDIIALCSDGLWDMLSDKEIEKIITKEGSSQKLCYDLINAAKNAGGEDNITVIIIKVKREKKD